MFSEYAYSDASQPREGDRTAHGDVRRAQNTQCKRLTGADDNEDKRNYNGQSNCIPGGICRKSLTKLEMRQKHEASGDATAWARYTEEILKEAERPERWSQPQEQRGSNKCSCENTNRDSDPRVKVRSHRLALREVQKPARWKPHPSILRAAMAIRHRRCADSRHALSMVLRRGNASCNQRLTTLACWINVTIEASRRRRRIPLTKTEAPERRFPRDAALRTPRI